MTIRAALLTDTPESGRGLFVRIDELADTSQLTANHLREITECDLPPNRYVWRGSTFVDQAALERTNRPDFDKAFAGLCATVEALGGNLPEETRAYLRHAGKRALRRRKGAL